jgi:hypothetical protein
MPQISQFYGIIITMYYNDHVPPHFHARYAEYKAEYAIADGARAARAACPGGPKRSC